MDGSSFLIRYGCESGSFGLGWVSDMWSRIRVYRKHGVLVFGALHTQEIARKINPANAKPKETPAMKDSQISEAQSEKQLRLDERM